MIALHGRTGDQLPVHLDEALPRPRYLLDAARQLVLGQLPVVRFSETMVRPTRYVVAGEVDTVIFVWRHEGNCDWQLVSVYLDEEPADI